ncbi:MAG: tail completion protein gp17 [Bacillota bacterium]
MNLKQAVFAHLQGVAGAGDRIYPILLPQKPTLPAVTYQVISDVPERDLAGTARRRARVQLSCWGATLAAATDLAAAVAARFQDLTGPMGTGGPEVLDSTTTIQADGFDDQVGIYLVPVDALILYRGGDT